MLPSSSPSQCSPGSIRPLSQASIMHSAEHPSPSTLFPSSHSSTELTTLSPQDSFLQSSLQPSPAIVFPSSHSSKISIFPSPHRSSWQVLLQPSPFTLDPSSHSSQRLSGSGQFALSGSQHFGLFVF